MALKIVLFEDNRALRESLVQLLSSASDMQVVAAYGSPEEGLPSLADLTPDVVLMDIDMPGIGGVEAVKQIKAEMPATLVMMLTVFEDEKTIFQALKAGASGYLLKKTSPRGIVAAVKDLASGGAPMTPQVARLVLDTFARTFQPSTHQYQLSEREKDVLRKLVEGHSYKMAAEALFISLDTVRSHVKSIYEKLHVNSKAEAVASALRNRIV